MKILINFATTILNFEPELKVMKILSVHRNIKTMKRELSFWKYEKEGVLNDEQVYVKLSEGEDVKGVEELPIEDAIKSIKAGFADWNCHENVLQKNDKTIEIFTTKQFVRFDCTSLGDLDYNRIIDIMNSYGCPLYDAAISTRYEA